MEALALVGLLGMGYVLTGNSLSVSASSKEEGYANSGDSNTSLPPLYEQVRTDPGAPTVPGKPRQPRPTADGSLDLFYQLPSSGSTAIQQSYPTTQVPGVLMNQPGVEEPPTFNDGQPFVSPLSGLTMSADDFTHANQVPFFRGQPKQNITDDANTSLLDQKIGTGFNLIGKREQAPLFDPIREPMGNVTGLENMTDFMHDRVVPSTNRAFEKPVEPTRVGPGLNQGYSSLPIGGFQQYDILETARQATRSVDELRSASNPRVQYEGMLNPGVAIGTMRGEIGEVRHYNPDKFYMNENGERNFVGPVADNLRPTVRSSQVMKFQAREETSGSFVGPAVASDYTATYTTPSFRAPFSQQNEGYGFRNADGSWAGVANTDATNNDYGAGSIELFANQRTVTGERGQTLNLTGMAAAPAAMTVYDPNDVARTTVRETTGANSWIGGAVAVGAKKLTVYDPTDIAKPTHRNTNAEVDTALNVTRAGVPGAPTLSFPDGVRTTGKEAISANSAYTGGAGRGNGDQVYDTAYAMRQNGIKELTAQGRKPLAGNGVKPLFNGEDYINMSNRKIMTDVLNDRDNTIQRVTGHSLGVEAIGLQRPKDVLTMDIARDRNYTDVLSSLNDNPYALPIHKIASQNHQAVAWAAHSLSG